jgi:hypothetical protein
VALVAQVLVAAEVWLTVIDDAALCRQKSTFYR